MTEAQYKVCWAIRPGGTERYTWLWLSGATDEARREEAQAVLAAYERIDKARVLVWWLSRERDRQ